MRPMYKRYLQPQRPYGIGVRERVGGAKRYHLFEQKSNNKRNIGHFFSAWRLEYEMGK